MVTAAMEMLVGLGIYLLPHEFAAPYYKILRPFFPALSAALVAGSLVLLLSLRYPLPWRWPHALAILPTAPLAVLAICIGLAGHSVAPFVYGLLAAATLVTPWLSIGTGQADAAAAPDLFSLTLALIQGSVGGYMLIRPAAVLPLVSGLARDWLWVGGLVGVAGALALLVPDRWRRPAAVRWVCGLAAAVLPVLVVSNALRSGLPIGVLSWGLLAAGLLGGYRTSGAPDRTPVQPEVPAGPGEVPLPAVERLLEAWSWTLALVIVVLAALMGSVAITPPVLAHLVVLALVVYNAVAHWVLPRFGSTAGRIFWHLAFLTLALGVLMEAGPVGTGFLALLVITPTMAAWALGRRAGVRILALALVMVGLGPIHRWLLGGQPLVLPLGESALRVLILAVAAAAGLRAARYQRRLLRDLARAHSGLQQKVDGLALLDHIGGTVRRSLDLDQILRNTAEELGRAFSASRCFICLRIGGEQFSLVHEYTAPEVLSREDSNTADCQPFINMAALQRRPVAVSDVNDDPLFQDPEMRRKLTLGAPGVRGILVAPILVDEDLLGVIGFHQCVTPRRWSDEEVALADAVAGQVGVALAHARAHRILAERHAELQRIHAALSDSEQRFRTAFGQAAVGMALMGTGGRFLQVNRSLAESLGYTEMELLTTTVFTLIHPEDLVVTAEHMRRLLDGESEPFQIEMRYLHKTGQVVWTLVSCSLVRDAQGQAMYFILQSQDITGRKQVEDQLVWAANYDALTELFNRRRFYEELEQELAQAQRYGTRGALLFLDLDGFKYVNDTLGHRAGDELLRTVAGLLKKRLRQTDILARLGGDEFAVILPRVDADQARGVAANILEAVHEHTSLFDGHPMHVTTSIGIALFPDHGLNAEELVTHADMAMYHAKGAGRNHYSVYGPGYLGLRT